MAYRVTQSDMDRSKATRDSLYRLMSKNRFARYRMAQLWKLFKAEYPNDPQVKRWRDLGKERQGFSPVVAVAMKMDPRFTKISDTQRKVYWMLS